MWVINRQKANQDIFDFIHKAFFNVNFNLFLKQEIYQHENVEQNPPWMPQKPINKLKYKIPKSQEHLLEVIKKQVSIILTIARACASSI